MQWMRMQWMHQMMATEIKLATQIRHQGVLHPHPVHPQDFLPVATQLARMT
jgi:hypothetical protein